MFDRHSLYVPGGVAKHLVSQHIHSTAFRRISDVWINQPHSADCPRYGCATSCLSSLNNVECIFLYHLLAIIRCWRMLLIFVCIYMYPCMWRHEYVFALATYICEDYKDSFTTQGLRFYARSNIKDIDTETCVRGYQTTFLLFFWEDLSIAGICTSATVSNTSIAMPHQTIVDL